MESMKMAVIGSYAIGMTITCNNFPAKGETVRGCNFELMHGGKGSNQAVAAARLGGDVIYSGCVGNDSFGDKCFQLHKEEKTDTSCIRRSRKGLSTGVGLVLVNAEGENEIVIDLAANLELSCQDIDDIMPVLRQCGLVLMQLEINMETVLYTAKKCREADILFVLNPAPYQELPEMLFEYCDYIIPNQTEARLMLGLSSDSTVSDEEVGKRLKDKGIKNIVMTLGRKGAIFVNEQGSKVISGICVKAVDTTGAGDTFSAAFCVALAEGKSPEDAIAFGNVAAGLAVTKYGVIDSIPNRETVEAYLKKKGSERE